MDLRQMEIFVAVAEEGSIHAAARRMYLSQPAISQAMRKLERSIGTALLVRSPRGVELTKSGALFLDRARVILRTAQEAVDEARLLGSRRALRVGVIAGHLGAGELTPLIVGEYRRSHPDVDLSVVDLSFANQVDAVADGDIDVSLARVQSERESAGLEFVPLFDEPRVLCFSAGLESRDESLSVDAALDLPVLRMVDTPDWWSSYWGLEEFRWPVHHVPSSAVTVSELQSAIAGSNCALSVALSGWRLAIRNPLLRAIPIDGAPTMVQAAHRPNESTAAEFAEFARRIAAENIGLVEGAVAAG